MADQFVISPVYQGSGPYSAIFDSFVSGNVYQGSSEACVVDLTPPTFAGIVSASIQSRGQIRATWAAASDPTLPIRYEVYIQVATNVGLFNVSNILAIVPNLQYDIWNLQDGSFLENGQTYYVGVKAIDGVNNRDNNSVSLSVISTGVAVASDSYSTNGVFSRNSNGTLNGTIWATKNGILSTSANSVLGTASYKIFDKTGTLVPGMTEAGLVADSNSQYHITPVSDTLSKDNNHYIIQIEIIVDGQVRTNDIGLSKGELQYKTNGNFFVDSNNQLQGHFWITKGEAIVTSADINLGVGGYQVYDIAGASIIGMGQGSISSDANGFFKITPVVSSLDPESAGYSVRLQVAIDGRVHSTFVTLPKKIPTYRCHGQFVINALNQLSMTLWATADSKVKKGTEIGTASYTVYDSSGVAIPGLTQSGLVADVNGRFFTTPVSASLISDLTNYNVRVAITIDGALRESYIGFTLLGN